MWITLTLSPATARLDTQGAHARLVCTGHIAFALNLKKYVVVHI